MDNFDGTETGTAADDRDDQLPFCGTGKLHTLALEVEPTVLTEADKKCLMQAYRNNVTSQ
jgi:hypothetical protein